MAKSRTIIRYRSRPKTHHKRAGMTLPLAAIAGFAPLVGAAVNDFRAGGVSLAGKGACARLTGYNPSDGKWSFGPLMEGLVPIMLGLGAHKVASKLGVNRMLAQAGVPLIRI